MPVENERKYVLGIEFVEDFHLIKWDDLARHVWTNRIEQGYLFDNDEMAARIRKIDKEFYFCFKKKVEDHVIEIENEISQSDFDALWPSTTSRVKKERHVIRCFHDGGVWEDKDGGVHTIFWDVDIFLDDNDKPYFVLAEHEMPEGKSHPDYFPVQIQEYLEYSVPRTRQHEFSSLRLGDKNYAISIEIPEEKK